MSVAKKLAALVLATGTITGLATAASAGDLLLTAAKPDHLYVIDAEKRSIRADIHVAGANGSFGTIVPAPDGRRVYMLINRMESIVGIDLKSGKTVFRADLSSAGERVKDFFALAVTPDGKELVSYQMRTKVLSSEYQVEEPRFAVYRTNAGLDAKPVRQFPAPRRVAMLLAHPGGRSFYAIGFDLYEYDLHDGRLLATRGIQKWNVPEHSQPDVLAFWPVTEPTGLFTAPVTADVQVDGKTVSKTGVMQLDLASGKLDFRDFEDTAAVIFSSVESPDRNTVFGVYTTLTKVDLATHTLAKRQALDHTYYAVNIASDGHEVYIGGAMCDVGFYDPATLEKRALLKLPGCGDQALASLRVIRER
jgi:quinohemoprotein amine dehydrogenase beta subunit